MHQRFKIFLNHSAEFNSQSVQEAYVPTTKLEFVDILTYVVYLNKRLPYLTNSCFKDLNLSNFIAWLLSF